MGFAPIAGRVAAVSYVAVVTDQFEEMTRFYGEKLRFPTLRSWDRSNSRGCVFDLRGMRLEILDNLRERHPLHLEPPADRFHLVIEVEEVNGLYQELALEVPAPVEVSWGARLFQVRDPDGLRVTFVEWLETDAPTRV